MSNEELIAFQKDFEERMMRAESASDEFVNDLYTAGKLNDIIIGAIRQTMESLCYKKKDIQEAVNECQSGTFDLFMAEQLRKKANQEL